MGKKRSRSSERSKKVVESDEADDAKDTQTRTKAARNDHDNDNDDNGSEVESSSHSHEHDSDANDDPVHSKLNENKVDDDTISHDRARPARTSKSKQPHKLSMTQTTDFNARLAKRGCIYLARIPPRMTPTKVKRLWSDYGVVTRVYFCPEDPAARKRRQQRGSGGRKRYTEGWVEFDRRRIAKRVAAALHLSPISQTKGDVHCDDTWSLKYLPKFQWSHLTEKVAYERRVRDQKLRLETLSARRDTQQYKRLVEAGQVLDHIEARQRQTKATGTATSGADTKKKSSFQIKPMPDDGAHRSNKTLLGALV